MMMKLKVVLDGLTQWSSGGGGARIFIALSPTTLISVQVGRHTNIKHSQTVGGKRACFREGRSFVLD